MRISRRNFCGTGAALFTTAAFAKSPPQDITLEQDFDELWETLRDRYAYFREKATDWDRVRAIYRPQLALVGDDEDKWKRLVNAVTNELYDAHTHFTTPEPGLPRWPLSDIMVEQRVDGVHVKAVREDSAASDAGVRIGERVVAIDGMPFERAAALRMPRALRRTDPAARDYAINAAIGGNRERERRLQVADATGRVRDLVLPYKAVPNRPAIISEQLADGFGYIAITTFGDNEAPAHFDAALEQLKGAPGLILDVRYNGGGDTGIAKPMMGRFITERKPYALMRRRSGRGVTLTDPWTEYVDPRGPFTYSRPVVVLTNHWSGSMAEGFPMGMKGIGRARVVGTPMMGLGAAVFPLRLDRTGVEVNYSAEPVYDVWDRPRWHMQPDVAVPDGEDILAAGVLELKRLLTTR
jgi:carboxyl-terminal processing protease